MQALLGLSRVLFLRYYTVHENELQTKTSVWIFFLNFAYVLYNILHVFMDITFYGFFLPYHKALCITNVHFVSVAGMLTTGVQ